MSTHSALYLSFSLSVPVLLAPLPASNSQHTASRTMATRQSGRVPKRPFLDKEFIYSQPMVQSSPQKRNGTEPPTPPTHHAMAGGRPVRDRQPTLSDKDWLDQNRANSGLCCCLHSRMSVLLVHLCMSLCVPAAACATHLRSTSSL